MVSASLSGLPPELICRIFQSADDFSVVAALAKTARNFYKIWREHPTFICKAVAPRIISNLADAEWLVDLQEEAWDLRQNGCDDRAILRAKCLLFNARCASAACETLTRLCRGSECWWNADKSFTRRIDPGQSRVFTPSELADFEHVFYCIWAVGVMARARHLREQSSAFLDRCDTLELGKLELFSSWLTHCYDKDYGSSGFKTWRAGCNLIYKRWSARYKDWLKGPVDGPEKRPVNVLGMNMSYSWR
jgi:hypothetical protein